MALKSLTTSLTLSILSLGCIAAAAIEVDTATTEAPTDATNEDVQQGTVIAPERMPITPTRRAEGVNEVETYEDTIGRPPARYRDNSVSNTINLDDMVTTDAEEKLLRERALEKQRRDEQDDVGKAGLETSPAVTREGIRVEPTLQATTRTDPVMDRDTAISKQIRDALRGSNLSTATKNVSIVTVDGVATLKGEVPTLYEKNRAGRIAGRIAPVVNNNLSVRQ